MKFREHMEDCRLLLGNDWKDVHLFLDKMAKEFPINVFGEYHRTFLHNTYGLTIIEHKIGKEAYLAGLIHLHADYLEARVCHLDLITVIRRAKKNMPWWDNCVYVDMGMLEMTKGGIR